jgi:amino acid transporter
LLDCFGLGVNGIIGSGIFLLPAALYRRAGGASPLAWLLVGGLCALVSLCFAEAAGRTNRSGGPYRYACDAFGPHIGFAVGWITLVSSLLGYAAVSRGFAEHAVGLLQPGRTGGPLLPLAVIALVLGLAVINIVGLKPSARMADTVGLLKLLGLFAFVAIGLFFLQASSFHAPPVPRAGETTGLGAAAFAGLFACTGFEYVPVPAGETRRPERVVGLAMVVSVLGATLLYAVIQAVAQSAAPNLGEAATPLVAAARAMGGPGAAAAMAAIGVISAFGFCSTSALVVPRYVETFAQDRFLPHALERRSPRFGTPVVAVLSVSLLVVVLATTLDFTQLADTSNVAVVVQYVSTCISILVTRRNDPERKTFRLPFGPLIPLAATVGCGLFMLQVAKGELLLSAALIGGGLALGAVTRRARPVV